MCHETSGFFGFFRPKEALPPLNSPAKGRSAPSFGIYPKAKQNVPAHEAHSVSLLLKNDSESVLFFCHFSDYLASFSCSADFNSGIRKASAKDATRNPYFDAQQTMIFLMAKSILLFFFFGFGEDDLIDKEEDYHRYTAVEHGGADIVHPIRHKLARDSHPNTVDGIDDAGNDDKSNQVPQNLIPHIALTAEHQVALNGEINTFTNDHGNHLGYEVP